MISIDLKGTLTITLNYVTNKTKAQIYDADGILVYSSAIVALETTVNNEFSQGTYKLNIVEESSLVATSEFTIKAGKG